MEDGAHFWQDNRQLPCHLFSYVFRIHVHVELTFCSWIAARNAERGPTVSSPGESLSQNVQGETGSIQGLGVGEAIGLMTVMSTPLYDAATQNAKPFLWLCHCLERCVFLDIVIVAESDPEVNETPSTACRWCVLFFLCHFVCVECSSK